MRNFSIFVVLVFGVLAAAVALYWFFEATTLPVASATEQAIQVLYNIHAAIWTLTTVVAFGLAGLLANAAPAERPAARPAARPSPKEEPRERPLGPRERPAGPRGRHERVEPRL
jgi:hypothetical protein